MISKENKYRGYRFLKYLFYGFFFSPYYLFAQKFHFQNYNVQQGLIQSQVNAITQDRFDNLWFCTLGGISRFDGKQFTNYSETDGLISNFSNSILADNDSNIWVGTMNGLSKFNGVVFKNIHLSESPAGNAVRSITEDNSHRIWVQASGKLYRIDAGDKPVVSNITGVNERISAIQVDKQGVLWAAVMGKGIFRLERGGWKMMILLPEIYDREYCHKIIFDNAGSGRIYLLTSNELLKADDSSVIGSLVPAGSLGMLTSMYQDKTGRIWLTGSRGLFQYSKTGLTSFDSENGYEGSKTSVIFQDREENIWFGTNGTGVFRYSYQPFLIFDQFSAARNRSIMPMLKNQNQLYLGTEGSGLYRYDGKNMYPVKGFSDDPNDQYITGLFPGNENEMYVLASSGLFKKYADGKFTKIPLGELKGCINSVLPDEKGGFWVASCMGFLNISSSGKTTHILNVNTERILPVSGDSLLVSANDGLYLVGNDFKFRKLSNPMLNKASYMALASMGKYYLLATANKGLIVYNTLTGSCRQYTKKDGLNADFIYSVVTDNNNQAWMGTGRGVNKITLIPAADSIQITSLSIPGDISSAECNQGGALLDDHHDLWIGTVSGLFKFFPDSVRSQTYFPPVILRNVQVFSKGIPPKRFAGFQNNWYSIPKELNLAHNENHLSFSFFCPSYLNSESILYQYQLEGLEKTYSALSPNNSVVYPALPPGHYTFRARAWVEGQGYSKNNVSFSFDIRAAFYQTLYFKLAVLVLALGIILWVQWLRIRIRVSRIQQMEEVKREENIKVRQTASEDFHDEVGNSLTRIQVLTDVLQTKLGNGHEEEKRLIVQIKENISGLYQGTRDILWALNPESDVITEIGHRLESLGIEVFQDTGVCFSYDNQLGESENVKLPGNYNRNIMMIFKEAMSNCLKHAQARHVSLTLQKSDLPGILIQLKDDGSGFNPLYIKKGHGFQNMQKRADRMNARFAIKSNPGEGARYELVIPVSITG